MRKRDAKNINPGDRIALKNRLGGGTVIKVEWTPDECKCGRFPMIHYKDVLGTRLWCTYLIVQEHIPVIDLRKES